MNHPFDKYQLYAINYIIFLEKYHAHPNHKRSRKLMELINFNNFSNWADTESISEGWHKLIWQIVEDICISLEL